MGYILFLFSLLQNTKFQGESAKSSSGPIFCLLGVCMEAAASISSKSCPW